MDPGIIALIVMVVVLLALLVFLLVYNAKQQKIKRETQRILTDRDLLRMIEKEPDGLLSVQRLADKTELTKGEARTRLMSLYQFGLLTLSSTRGSKYYFGLREALDEREPPELSPEPFLTVDDLLRLFKHFDYQLDAQKMVMATGLPLKIIDREMKYFEKEGIIKLLFTRQGATVVSRQYYLEEPYRSNPDRFLQREREMNEKVREILREDLML